MDCDFYVRVNVKIILILIYSKNDSMIALIY